MKQDSLIEKKILKIIEKNNFQNICLYMSGRYEIPTQDIIEKLKNNGKNIFIPSIKTATEMKLTKFINISVLQKWSFGIMENPSSSIYEWDIDVFFIPWVAFSQKGKRIGRGKGYYDRFLAQDKYKSSLKVGVCYDFQVYQDFDIESWDIDMHHLV